MHIGTGANSSVNTYTNTDASANTDTDTNTDMNTDTATGTGTGSCAHISSALASPATSPSLRNKFKTVVAWHARKAQDAVSTPPTKRRRVSAPQCGVCHTALSRPLACLSCPFAGCWAGEHAVAHLAESGHPFCVDVKSGSVFCAHCDGFVYNPVIDDMYLSTVVLVEENQTRFQVSKRTREPYQPWIPTEEEMALLKGATIIPCQGRRGLLNLGQTCFLNVVLQSFIHNPLLRNYFLSDQHNSRLCKHTDCICCEMDNLFTEIYSSTTAPFGPTSFLATMWKVSPKLSGYAQQDAHEFFLHALGQIHLTCRGSTNISCNCIVHQTFLGQLQSEVTCERCGSVTRATDDILDISLELRDPGVEKEITLAGCLRRYTKPEKLGKEYSCAKCVKATHEAVRRLSILKLPPVLSFQFKRFEHKTVTKGAPQKIDTPVRFPVSINMAPYTTFATAAGNKDGEAIYPGPDAMYEYDLFAVINHEGQLENGHYTNFARFQDEWYRFDDDKVTPSSLGACLGSTSNAYMCFYVKRHLDYKPYMKPTYRVARENDIVREQEQEKLREMARIKEVDDALMMIAGI